MVNITLCKLGKFLIVYMGYGHKKTSNYQLKTRNGIYYFGKAERNIYKVTTYTFPDLS